ncbi:helix-turn-helix domain-containing protein [Microbispora cellulosiformans]|uniref:Helix-turn-helix domain-containing protein n=1 Tax=Microbispora cellulosiformans TaxID=2614688 RepID=A0A5J5K852_9ACTN|nr:helix-turn-helix transcriptional regulator [Microbispora cellulosiformans]KAA9380934.1 helix-turn-helix domain-containing protein [Microbispora cellulosiformans]
MPEPVRSHMPSFSQSAVSHFPRTGSQKGCTSVAVPVPVTVPPGPSDAAARQLGWSRSKLKRVENARFLPGAADIGKACDLYSVDGTGKAGLVRLGKDAGG